MAMFLRVKFSVVLLTVKILASLLPSMITSPIPIISRFLIISKLFSVYVPALTNILPVPASPVAISIAFAIVATGDSSLPSFSSFPSLDT